MIDYSTAQVLDIFDFIELYLVNLLVDKSMDSSLDVIAILDQVTNTEGVSYAVFITSMTAVLASFIAVIGVLSLMVNNQFNKIDERLIRMEDKHDKTNDKIDKTNESLFLIKAHLGIIRVEEKSNPKPVNSENSKE